MAQLRQCSRCKHYGHNKRTCPKTEKQAKEMKEERDKFDKLREERQERDRKALFASLVEGLNMLGSVASLAHYLEGDTPFGGVYLETPIEGLHIDGPEAVAVMVAGIAQRIKGESYD